MIRFTTLPHNLAMFFQLTHRLRMELCCSLMMSPYNVWQCQSHLSVLAPLMNLASLSLSLLPPMSLASPSVLIQPLCVWFLLKVSSQSRYRTTYLTTPFIYQTHLLQSACNTATILLRRIVGSFKCVQKSSQGNWMEELHRYLILQLMELQQVLTFKINNVTSLSGLE